MDNQLKKLVLLALIFQNVITYGQPNTKVNYVSSFDNINHPQIAYWFFSKDQLKEKNYKSKIDSLSKYSKYTLVFLTARNGVDFYDTRTMHPIFKDVVSYAKSKGLQIGLQLWDKRTTIPIAATERAIQESEVVLDSTGSGNLAVEARHIRDKKQLFKSELFRVLVFRKKGAGFYDASTLKDITSQCKPVEAKEKVELTLNVGKKYAGYTAYILTQHYYNYASNHGDFPVNNLKTALKAYADIPFEGVGLDEYTNLRVATTWELKNGDRFTERLYSLPMAAVYKKNTGQDLERTLFDMRYAPFGKPEIRMQAINAYMSLMRSGTMNIERAIYDTGKEVFGKNTFIGLHDTHHNSLDGDEIWQTGLNWWNVKRDYGHTDEGTPTPTQMGIGMSYPMNILYNMYYNKSLDNIFTKALTDLRYGIRTHYHAINDVQNWGVSVEKPEALGRINQVENAARLLNRFNPSFPQVKLLVIFGMEALANWYPDSVSRGITDINNSLHIEEKAMKIWQAGYLNALVPTDVIADGRLKIGIDGKAILQGHKFDAIVFLYPQYAKEETLLFLEKYISKGGKLMVEGNVTNDYFGRNISDRWKKIADNPIVKSFSVENIESLGVTKSVLADGTYNEDGSFTFTSAESLKANTPASFTIQQGGVTYIGTYSGLAAIKADSKGNLQKFTATGFSSLKKNGQTIFSLDKAADVYLEIKNGIWSVTIAAPEKTVKVITNKL